MPDMRPSSSRSRNLQMREAAAQGMIITVRCALCRRTVNFWAADLLQVLGPTHQVHIPPFPCGRGCPPDMLSVRWTVPGPSVLQAGLTVRRPVRQIVKWIWRDEKV